jgi:hypothetical protein
MSPPIILQKVENAVDQGEQVSACAKHAVERLGVPLQRLRILPQHLGHADDGDAFSRSTFNLKSVPQTLVESTL